LNEEIEIQDAVELAIKSIMRNCVTVEGTITKVNNDFTVDVTVGKDEVDGGSTFYSVPMMCLPAVQASVIQIPKLNSDCHISFLDNTLERPQLVRVNEVTDYLIGTQAGQVNIKVNGGTLGGIPKAKEIQTQSNLDKAILQAFLQIINGPPIDEPGNGAPSALQIALKAALAGKQPGTWDNLENPKFTQ